MPTKEVELTGRLHCDLFLQDRYLLDGVPMKLELLRSPDEFFFMCAADGVYKLALTKAKFYVRHLNIDPDYDEPLQAIYRGTLARDDFARLGWQQDDPFYPKVYVVNTDSSDQPGAHWVSIYRPAPGSVEMMDSYGLYSLPLIKETLNRMGQIQQRWNTHPLQRGYSTLCGLYCLYMLTYRVRGWTFNQVLDTLDWKDTAKNDAMVLAWFHTKVSTSAVRRRIPYIKRTNLSALIDLTLVH